MRPLQKRLEGKVGSIMLKTKVSDIKAQKNGLKVSFEGDKAPDSKIYDKVLGRRAHAERQTDQRRSGRVCRSTSEASSRPTRRCAPMSRTSMRSVTWSATRCWRTRRPTRQGGGGGHRRPAVIVRSDDHPVRGLPPTRRWPGWAWTETEAKARASRSRKGLFPGRPPGALGIGRDEGMTKLIFDAKSKRLLGAGIVGRNAGELIGETVLGLEMGRTPKTSA